MINIGRYFRKGCVNTEERKESDRERISRHLMVRVSRILEDSKILKNQAYQSVGQGPFP